MRTRVKVIDRYLASEFTLFFVLGVIVFLIFVMGNTVLFQLMDFIIDKKVPLPVFMKILYYMTPSFLVLAFPLASLFATLLAVGRLSRDGEIDVMRTSGISLTRILAPFLVAGVLASALDFFLLERVVPEANHRSSEIWRRFMLSDVAGTPMENVFFKGKKGRFFYIGRLDPPTRTATSITIYDTEAGNVYPQVILAPSGEWTEKTLKLKDGIIHSFREDGAFEYEARFDEMVLDLERQMEEIMGEQKSPQEMSIRELKDQIALFRKSGINTASLETDLHFKTSIPAACLICVLVGVPLSIRTGRGGAMSGVVWAIALIAVYYVWMIVDTALGRKGVIPPVAAAWLQNAAFLILGIYLIVRARK
ncbi:MAG: LptF/LptG family permease [bacterium]